MNFEIGNKYNFFDDGKISLSRHYIAEVTDIIPILALVFYIIYKIQYNK